LRAKLIVIILSILMAGFLMSGGYGLWEKTLVIRGSLEIARPVPPKQAKLSAAEEILNNEEPPAVLITGSNDGSGSESHKEGGE